MDEANYFGLGLGYRHDHSYGVDGCLLTPTISPIKTSGNRLSMSAADPYGIYVAVITGHGRDHRYCDREELRKHMCK